MKKIITALLLLAASQVAVAGTFNFKGTSETLTNADLDGKLGDLVTDKFIEKYPSKKWTIYVQTSTGNSNSNGSTLYFVSVGVAPKNLNGLQPAEKSWSRITHNNIVVNASLKDKKPLLVKEVRLALQDMMDTCEKSPSCDIDK